MLFSLKTLLLQFACIIQNPVVSVWYYHLPFFINVETQVPPLSLYFYINFENYVTTNRKLRKIHAKTLIFKSQSSTAV